MMAAAFIVRDIILKDCMLAKSACDLGPLPLVCEDGGRFSGLVRRFDDGLKGGGHGSGREWNDGIRERGIECRMDGG